MNSKQPQASDFILKDTQGTIFHLFDELSAGKTVVLDFFSVNCGPCASSVPVLETLWQNNVSTTNDLWVWGIEAYLATNAQIDAFSMQNGGTYPCFTADENDSIIQQYDIQYTPRFYVICPDKRRIPSLLGDLQLNIEQCRLLSENILPESPKEAVVFMSDKEQLYFSFTAHLNGLFEIVDIYGRKVFTTSLNTTRVNPLAVQKSIMKKGIYFYHFIGNNSNKFQGKFMVL
jgi:thiol-disulfide isomerase/thioredoxin